MIGTAEAKSSITLSDDQQCAVDAIERWLDTPRHNRGDLTMGGYAGSGKALALDTQIPTPYGWTTMGEIKVGDVVFSQDGSQTIVIACSEVQINRECYRVTFDDGESVVADSEHLWLTMTEKERGQFRNRDEDWKQRRRESREPRGTGARPWMVERNKAMRAVGLPQPRGTVRTTGEIARTLYSRKQRLNHSIDAYCALRIDGMKLPVDPYLLGVWIGDGTSDRGTFTTQDIDIVDAFSENYLVTPAKGTNDMGYKVHGLKDGLRVLGLIRNKHIPTVYLRASHEYRLALLQGLMDSDGFADKDSGSVEFCNTNPRIIDGVVELLRSLGIKTCQPVESIAKLYGREISPKWRVIFTTKHRVFRLKRKLDRQCDGKSIRNKRRYVVSVNPVPSVPVKCIQVEHESHMYLAGKGMVPTHNSTIINHIFPRLRDEGILMMAPTGKAANVLRNKGIATAVTIHQAIYLFKGLAETRDGSEVPIFEDREEWKGTAPRLLGVDESSMVNGSMYRDIRNKNIPCLWVGDHGQIPPIGDDPGLMQNPNIRLEKIHRQAEGSAILRLAHALRQGESFSSKYADNKSVFIKSLPTDTMKVKYALHNEIDQIIVSFNATRFAINKIYRSMIGRKDILEVGDRIVCTHNDWDNMMFNGQVFTVDTILEDSETYVRCRLVGECGERRNSIKVQKISLGNPDYKSGDRVDGLTECQYGYSMTAHKCQGDAWNRVLYIDQPCKAWSAARHRYTGVTRSIEQAHCGI